MEATRARLLAVTAAQTRAAGFAPGTERAGLPQLVASVDQERSAAEEDRELLRARLDMLHNHPVGLHSFETFAAARAAALVEHLRYAVIRDIRDLLAADQLEIATYTLLAAAAGARGRPRDGEPPTPTASRGAHRGGAPDRRTRLRPGSRA